MVTLRSALLLLSSTALCSWFSSWWKGNHRLHAASTFLWLVTIKGTSTPSWTMLLEKCPIRLSWWSWSTRFIKRGTCWLLHIPREMKTSGQMSWRILILWDSVLPWRWTFPTCLLSSCWFPNYWNQGTLIPGSIWGPTHDLRVQGGCSDSRPRGNLCGCLWRCLRAACWNVFPFTPVRRGGVGYRGSPLHTGVFFWSVIFGLESHTEGSGIRTLAPRYHRKSMLLLFTFHFLDVCRHIWL